MQLQCLDETIWTYTSIVYGIYIFPDGEKNDIYPSFVCFGEVFGLAEKDYWPVERYLFPSSSSVCLAQQKPPKIWRSNNRHKKGIRKAPEKQSVSAQDRVYYMYWSKRCAHIHENVHTFYTVLARNEWYGLFASCATKARNPTKNQVISCCRRRRWRGCGGGGKRVFSLTTHATRRTFCAGVIRRGVHHRGPA